MFAKLFYHYYRCKNVQGSYRKPPKHPYSNFIKGFPYYLQQPVYYKRVKEIAKQQVALFNSSNKRVCYGAITRLRAQYPAVLENFEAAITHAMKDEYSPVAITASVVACEVFKNKQAKDALKNFCTNNNGNLTLITINYLLYDSDKTPFIESIKAMQEKKDTQLQRTIGLF